MQTTDLVEFEENSGQSNLRAENFLREYHLIVDDLKKEIDDCKKEQTRLRNELETVREESKTTNDVVQECFSQMHDEKCPVHSENENLMIENLEKRLAVMHMEKESVFQLWQVSLKAIDVLEEELRSCQQGREDVTIYEQQISTIKNSYSEAIKELESKLVESKQHFLLHQSLFESNKSKIEHILKEKDQLSRQLEIYEHNLTEKDETCRREILEATEKLDIRTKEVVNLEKNNKELQEKLNNVQKLLANAAVKENDNVSKVSEALELVEAALREKEEAVKRETRALEKATELRYKWDHVEKDFAQKLQDQVAKVKELHDSNLQKYLSEIEQLKQEIQQKTTLTNRVQRECRVAQEELDKVEKRNSNFCQKSETKISELERKIADAEMKLQTCEETWRLKYNEKCLVLEQYDKLLNEKLYEPNEKLRKAQTGVEDLVKEVNERTKETVKKYYNIEKSLSKTLSDKEKIDLELHNLQLAFERETDRRNRERKLLEMKIKNLEEELRVATSRSVKKNEQEFGSCFVNTEANTQIKQLKERNDLQVKELTSHVEVHQKLNLRWKEEIKWLTIKFKKHLKELRNKINALHKENEELNKELFVCRHKLAQFNSHILSWQVLIYCKKSFMYMYNSCIM